jgi:phosphoribosyl-ATP pyrophosphohydrolase/phosphoribosyl-AMP cyclohydrolase
MERVIHQVRFDEKGLIPAIVQDSSTNEVLALCYMSDQSLARTLQSGRTFFAGVEDRNFQFALVDIRVNPAGDSLTVLVERDRTAAPETPSSLKDLIDAKRQSPEVSLVDIGSMEFGLAINDLYNLIADRKEHRPEGSYTTYLFNSGLDKILKKIAEEAGEVIIASKNKSARDVVSELADLFYHLLVLMVEREVNLSDVHNELVRRANRSSRADDNRGPASESRVSQVEFNGG